MNVAIIQFPGTNCERDTQYAYECLGAKTHIVWHQEKQLPNDCALVVLPGGFSYGDYLRCGAIARFSPIIEAIKDFANAQGFVLGICNGFQILCEIGLLPGALKRNENLHFISKIQSLKVVHNDNAFLRPYILAQEIKLPIAHADGHYFIDAQGLESLKKHHQILLEYINNPNGSVAGIAGICNKQKNVFGLMPHPERAIEDLLGGCDGLLMLKNLLQSESARS